MRCTFPIGRPSSSYLIRGAGRALDSSKPQIASEPWASEAPKNLKRRPHPVCHETLGGYGENKAGDSSGGIRDGGWIPLAREVWDIEEHEYVLRDAYYAEVEEPAERGAAAVVDLDAPLDQIYVFPAGRRVVLGMRILRPVINMS
jgi:hypothetical protein